MIDIISDQAGGVTPTEQRLFELCKQSFLSYWSFANPYRRAARTAKEVCDVLVVCDKHILVFSDKSTKFPTGDTHLAWNRWHNRSVGASARQLHGAHRLLTSPNPEIFSDQALDKRIRCDLPSMSNREIHLIAIANGATEACRQVFSEPMGTLMMTNDPGQNRPFTVGDIGHPGPFVHTLTDLSLELILRELDTIIDFTRYLHNREKFFRSDIRFIVPGEEALLPLYFRGYSDEARDYDIRRALRIEDEKPDFISIGGDFWDDLVKRPEYQARIQANKVSYLWDRLIEKFSRHQIQGTGTSHRPVGFERHEGGLRYMALEPRAMRRGLSSQIMTAVEAFPENLSFGVRSILPSNYSESSTAYIFMQLAPPDSLAYPDYRHIRAELLGIYVTALLHDHDNVLRVVGIATEPPRLFSGKPISEDLALAERSVLSSEDIANAKKQKASLGIGNTTAAGTWTVREFPEPGSS